MAMAPQAPYHQDRNNQLQDMRMEEYKALRSSIRIIL
jgi:hypothetical protein